MATRALRKSRTVFAAVLLVGLVAALLVAWFFSGWADVRAQQRELRAAPQRAIDVKAATLASELRNELSHLLVREAERPYFHYQNLFHDPRTGRSLNVSTSPLATGPQDQMVLGYFHLDQIGRVTTPTINDEAPHLSEPTRIAENRRFRDEVVRGFSRELRSTAKPERELLAEATVQPKPRPLPPKAKTTGNLEGDRESLALQQQQRTQVVQLDPQSYVQNNMPNEVYWNYMGNQPGNQTKNTTANNYRNVPIDVVAESLQSEEAADETPSFYKSPTQPPRTKPKPIETKAVAEGATKPVTITISPFEWQTYPFGGAPALVAVRHVETPDGVLAQGFVVDRSALTSWLASRAGDSVAQLVVLGDEGATNEIAPGWQLVVDANPRTLATAAANASAVASSFLMRFVLIGLVATLAAMLVLGLVARAERLARERSQFAAAAAHELRTPLAGLQLYGDMLADGLGDPGKLRDYARRMSEEAARLGRVVSNVLGFSQLERGNLSIDPKPGPLGEVLKELAERAEPALDRSGAMLALDVAPDLRARYDRDALIRIVGNLLDNAEKYGRAAEDRTIELTAKETADAVEVTVSDHGPGVAQDARARLFQAFARGVDQDGPAGLGLGLALSQSLARAMGGDLMYQPSDTGGATFVLRLERAEVS